MLVLCKISSPLSHTSATVARPSKHKKAFVGPGSDEKFSPAGPGTPPPNGTGSGEVFGNSDNMLYRVDTAMYTAVPIALTGGDSLGGGDVCTADGMLLDGHTLYVSQNFLNRIAVIELTPDHFDGVITRYITQPFASNPATKVPTTIAEFGNSLYAVTAGFAPPAPDFVVRLPK